jgi:hypothetical protein
LKGTFPKWTPIQKKFRSANPFLHYSPEYKIQDVHLAAILSYSTETKAGHTYIWWPPSGHLGFWAALVFEMNLPLVDLKPQKQFEVNWSKYTKFKMSAWRPSWILSGAGFRKEPSGLQPTKMCLDKSEQVFFDWDHVCMLMSLWCPSGAHLGFWAVLVFKVYMFLWFRLFLEELYLTSKWI